MIKKITQLFAALLLFSYPVFGQVITLNPYIFLGKGFLSDELYSYSEQTSKKTYKLSNADELFKCRELLTTDIKSVTSLNPFRYFIIAGDYGETGIGNITVLLKILLGTIDPETIKKYSFFLEMYDSRYKQFQEGDDLVLQRFIGLPDHTLLVYPPGMSATWMNEDVFIKGLEETYSSAFERMIYRIISSPMPFRIILKNGSEISTYEYKGWQNKIVNPKEVGTYLSKEVNTFCDWWKKQVLPSFEDKVKLSENMCNKIAKEFIKELAEKLKIDYMQQLLLYAVYNDDEEAIYACLQNKGLDLNYTIRDMSLTDIMVSNKRYNSSLLKELWHRNYIKTIRPRHLYSLVQGWNDPLESDETAEKKEKFIRQLLDYGAGITKQIMSDVKDENLMETLLLSGSFLDTKWDYNDLVNLLSSEESIDMAMKIIYKYTWERCLDSKLDARLFYQLFDERAWIKKKVFFLSDFREKLMLNDENVKPKVARMLKCGLSLDKETPALFAAIKFAADEDTAYNDVVEFLVDKYTRDKIALPYSKSKSDEYKSAFKAAVEEDNIKALSLLLKARNPEEKFYYQDVLHALKHAIEMSLETAIGLILKCPEFELEIEEKIKILEIAKATSPVIHAYIKAQFNIDEN